MHGDNRFFHKDGMSHMGTLVVRLRQSGMFCELNHTIAAAGYAEDNGLAFRPLWVGGLYSEPGVDAWPVFFEQPDTPGDITLDVRNRDRRFRPYGHYAAPRGGKLPADYQESKCSTFLLPPRNRQRASRLIRQYIQPKPAIIKSVQDQHRKMLSGYDTVLGVHLRGPLRLHGGAAYLSDQLGYGRPPYRAYFNKIDLRLKDAEGSAAILLCTDAGCVVDKVRKRYGDRVIAPSQCLPKSGEPHKSDTFDPYTLGVDALKDAWLLSMADALVHGNSNMSNFVLCLNPKMPSHDVYKDVYL